MLGIKCRIILTEDPEIPAPFLARPWWAHVHTEWEIAPDIWRPIDPSMWWLRFGERVEGRAAVRVAMQWSAGPGAGFTTGDPAVPLVTEGPCAPDRVNVADQRRDPESLLN